MQKLDQQLQKLTGRRKIFGARGRYYIRGRPVQHHGSRRSTVQSSSTTVTGSKTIQNTEEY
eukprot:scaffold16058_cov106-Skeletonema_dohrnii-CCMP3373.AAC.1